MARPSALSESKQELATLVQRVLGHGTLEPVSVREASRRTGGAVHFSTINNMANGMGASPDAARQFAEAFGQDPEYWSALAAGVPSRLLRNAPGAALDVLDKLGVRIDPAMLSSVPMSSGEITEDGRLVVGSNSSSLAEIVGGSVEAVRISGNALAPEIVDGDIVLVRRTDKAVHGQLVVALIGSHTPFIKRFDTSHGKPWLKSLDGSFVKARFVVSGVVVGIIRTF